MDRVFESGAAVAAPTVPSSPSAGYPTAGNPATGTIATKPGPYWFHQVTEEIRNAIVAAGLAPSSTALDQLSTAIGTIASKNSVVGALRNAKMALTSASASAAFTADGIIAKTALSGIAYLLSAFNKTVNLATTGAGGMDTGSAPTSGFVALYAIYNASTSTANILAVDATSSAAPEIYAGTHMPSGYTASALISVWRTNSSGLMVIGTQCDRLISFPDVQAFTISNDVYISISGTLSLTGVVPPNAFSLFGNLKMGSASLTVYGWSVSGVNSVGMSGYDVYSAVPFSDLILAAPQSLVYGVGTGSSPVTMTLYIDGYKF